MATGAAIRAVLANGVDHPRQSPTAMLSEQQQLQAAIAALEAQRALLGTALVEAALTPLRQRLAALDGNAGAPATASGDVQSLKQVSILFLDVAESTTLSQHLDPEDVHAIMDHALARFTTIVQAHGGKVLNYAGDSVLAVFGADEVREDDPERAVDAGLDMLAEGRLQGERVQAQYRRSGFNVRVGIHTGAALLGGGIDAEGSIRGFAVNVAARMEQSAPVGTLRISHDTYRHVRGVFDVVAQAPIHVKGVDEPLPTYLVQRRKPRAFRVTSRGIEGVETRMVGRDDELEQLQAAFHRLYTQRKLAVVTVLGEAGIGKSRLLYEFDNWAEAQPQDFYFFQGRAHPQTQNQAYGLLRDILAWRLQITDSDSMALARQKFEQGLMPLFAAQDGDEMAQAHTHLLGHLIGLDFADSPHIKGIAEDGRQIRNRGFHAAAQMLRCVAAQDGAPILLLLDDLHYADEGSLDFLNYLTQVNRDQALLIVVMTRPAHFKWGAHATSTVDMRLITLDALDKSSSRLLVNELLKKLPQVPAALRELITGGAEGNPFYMEELVKMLVDEGAIVVGVDSWTINPEKLLATQVPPTLTGVLQARLDRLHPAERHALQKASVIGFVFWDQALAALDPAAVALLPALVRHELVVAHPDSALESGVAGLREYAFSHQLLHQVTYATLLKAARREDHGRVARWLCSLSGARARDFLGATAEHFVHAGDTAQGCEFFTRAAEHAAARYAHEAATRYVTQALALASTLSGQASGATRLLQWRLHDVRERTLDLLGKRSEQEADINALHTLAQALDDDQRRAEVAWRRSNIAMRTGDFPAMQVAAQQTMTLAERAGDAVLRLRGLHRLALAHNYLGDAASAQALAQDGLLKARALALRALEALFLNALSVIADTPADRIASLEMDQQDLLINRELGNRRNEAIALGNLGQGWLHLGEHTQARLMLEDSLRLARAISDHATQPATLTNLSLLALRQGDDALALAHAQAALDIATEVQNPDFETVALCALGNAELALGRHPAAQAAFARAHSLAERLGRAAQHDASAGLARVALAQDDVATAMHAIEGPLQCLSNSGALTGAEAPHLVRLTCHQVLARAGDARARRMLAHAHAELLVMSLTISDPKLRHSFLHNIPEHQAIMTASQADPASRV